MELANALGAVVVLDEVAEVEPQQQMHGARGACLLQGLEAAGDQADAAGIVVRAQVSAHHQHGVWLQRVAGALVGIAEAGDLDTPRAVVQG